MDRKAFVRAVIERGDAVPSWPEDCYGRGLSTGLSKVIAREYAAVRAPGAGQATRTTCGPIPC
ncbi:MAG: hypothetical protein U5R31_17560 [Acidimicrobiia bacterium]|nr:hypothetical protein [Acidimicrobiia bacterium]